MTEPQTRARLDKWLWYARFFKTRGLATRTVAAGHVRVNSQKVLKPAAAVAVGDVLTFAQGRAVRIVRIAALGERRGPASEARTLYDDLSPPEEDRPQSAPGFDGGGRPTKRDRRMLQASRDRLLE